MKLPSFATMFAARGRPPAQEAQGEVMVVGDDLLASMTSPTQGGVYFLPVDEIIKRKGWSTYKEMANDDQVKVCLEFKKVLVVGRTYEISPCDETPEAKKQAQFVEDVLERLPMKQIFKEGVSAMEFGFSLAEQVFERDVWDEDGQTYIFIKKLAHRDPSTIELKMDENGNFLGARQRSRAKYIELAPSKLWLFSHEPQFGNLYGTSDLRAAYRSWYAKKFVIQFWNVFLERMGSPLTTMKYPTGASPELKALLKKILTNLSSKTEILIPEGVEINLVEATRGGNATYGEALAFHNASIARGILMAALLGANGDKPTQAADSQSFLHLRILFKLADEISQKFSQSFMEQVIRPLLAMNFETVEMPNFIWQDYGQFEGMKVADEIRQLHAAGIIDMDQNDVNYVRSIMGLPLRDLDKNPDAVQRPAAPPPPGNANAPPPAAPQGNSRADKGGSATGDSTGAPQ